MEHAIKVEARLDKHTASRITKIALEDFLASFIAVLNSNPNIKKGSTKMIIDLINKLIAYK